MLHDWNGPVPVQPVAYPNPSQNPRSHRNPHPYPHLNRNPYPHPEALCPPT